MSTQSQNVSINSSYMSRLATIVPGVRAVKSIQVTRSKRHSLQDAREAVAHKLRENLAYLRDPVKSEQPDLVYKVQLDGRYSVGIKYGNRWLASVFDGNTYVPDLTTAQLCELLDLFATDALAGQFDDFIKPIMDANIKARAKLQ